MSRLERMLHAHPAPASGAGHAALALIEAASECADICSTGADACLSEPDPTALRKCVRLNLDCADVCTVTARVISGAGARDRRTLEALLEACAAACRACADECDRHDHEHCRICAEACRACEEACGRMEKALVA